MRNCSRLKSKKTSWRKKGMALKKKRLSRGSWGGRFRWDIESKEFSLSSTTALPIFFSLFVSLLHAHSLQTFWDRDRQHLEQKWKESIQGLNNDTVSKDWYDIKSIPNPHPMIRFMMDAVCVVFFQPTTWKNAQSLCDNSEANAARGDESGLIHTYQVTCIRV